MATTSAQVAHPTSTLRLVTKRKCLALVSEAQVELLQGAFSDKAGVTILLPLQDRQQDPGPEKPHPTARIKRHNYICKMLTKEAKKTAWVVLQEPHLRDKNN